MCQNFNVRTQNMDTYFKYYFSQEAAWFQPGFKPRYPWLHILSNRCPTPFSHTAKSFLLVSFQSLDLNVKLLTLLSCRPVYRGQGWRPHQGWWDPGKPSSTTQGRTPGHTTQSYCQLATGTGGRFAIRFAVYPWQAIGLYAFSCPFIQTGYTIQPLTYKNWF